VVGGENAFERKVGGVFVGERYSLPRRPWGEKGWSVRVIHKAQTSQTNTNKAKLKTIKVKQGKN
jgi:hypothetical protein